MSHPSDPPPYIMEQPQAQYIHVQPQSTQQPVPPYIVPSVVIGQQMGTKPSVIVCKYCRHDIVTRTEKKATTRTHIFACLLCLFLCWPCVCVPYCIPSCNNVDHYCPKCNSYVGSYNVYFS